MGDKIPPWRMPLDIVKQYIPHFPVLYRFLAYYIKILISIRIIITEIDRLRNFLSNIQ